MAKSEPKDGRAMPRRTMTLNEYLSQPTRPVTRGEMWWMFNYYERNRRRATPFRRFLVKVRLWAAYLNPMRFFREHIELNGEQPMPTGDEAVAATDVPTQEPSHIGPAKKFDAQGRLVDA